MPPPKPPPCPGPWPGPVPEPTPLLEPEPMPPPTPGPLEAGPLTLADMGLPRFGILGLSGSFTFGGATTVASTASFGLVLVISTVGGAICSGAILGRWPLLSKTLAALPPPPPPASALGATAGFITG